MSILLLALFCPLSGPCPYPTWIPAVHTLGVLQSPVDPATDHFLRSFRFPASWVPPLCRVRLGLPRLRMPRLACERWPFILHRCRIASRRRRPRAFRLRPCPALPDWLIDFMRSDFWTSVYITCQFFLTMSPRYRTPPPPGKLDISKEEVLALAAYEEKYKDYFLFRHWEKVPFAKMEIEYDLACANTAALLKPQPPSPPRSKNPEWERAKETYRREEMNLLVKEYCERSKRQREKTMAR